MPDAAEEALFLKTYHEWGYRFNDSSEIGELTNRQKQMILLAERAEQYIKREQREKAENRDSISHNEYNVQQSRAKAFQ